MPIGDFMKNTLIILLTGIIVISGCAKEQQATIEPAPRVVTVPAFAKAAVSAVGGEKAWADTEVIVGECTAKFYRPDNSFYLTRQRHAVYPWSDSVRIYASEPQGTFVWQLTGDDLTLLEGTSRQAAKLPITLCDPSIARALWSIMAAPASLAANVTPAAAALGEAIRVEGLWHYPVELGNSRTWYLGKDTGIFDIYRLGVSGKPAFLTVRGYDYRTIEKTNIMVPAKIEIFTAKTSGSELQRIIEFNYHTLESVGF